MFLVLSGGGPDVKDSAGNNWTGAFIDANGDPTVDLRNNLAAESRAKVVYEYLKQFTDDPGVQDTLTFLMTREVTHYQQFTAALNELPVNFPPGQLPGDPRFQNVAFNMSNGDGSVRGPWNEGQGPWRRCRVGLRRETGRTVAGDIAAQQHRRSEQSKRSARGRRREALHP